MATKLTKIRRVGRFANAELGKEVNFHKGEDTRGCDVLFYFFRQKRIYVSDADFYHGWKEVKNV